MPTVIDAFIVTLGLDPTKYKQGQKDAVEASKRTKQQLTLDAKEMEARGEQAAQFFGQIKREAVGLLAVLVGANGLKDFVSQSVTNISALGRTATAMNLNVAELAAFRNYIQRTGGDADAATTSFKNLTQALEDWRTLGRLSGDQALAFARIQGQAADNALTIFQKYADWAEKQRDKALVVQEGKLLGFDEGTINAAIKGGAAARAGIAESYRLGVPTEEDARKVQALQAEFLRLKQAITGDAQALLYEAAPALTGFLHLVDSAATKFPGLTKAAIALGVAFATLKGIAIVGGVLRLVGGGAAAAGAGGAAAGAGLGGALLPAAGLGAGIWAGNRAGNAWGETPAGQEYQRRAGEVGGRVGTWIGRAINRARGVPMGGGGGPGPGAATGGNLIEAFFIAHGASPQAARGIAAGVMAEGGTADARNPRSTAYGAGQWLKARQADFRRVMGKDIHGSSLQEQLQFMMWELTHTESAAGWKIRNAGSAEDALRAYVVNYMRPGSGTAGDLRRGARALGHSAAAANAFANTTTVHIDTINVNTKATDAKGIAAGMGAALRENLAAQANTGLSG